MHTITITIPLEQHVLLDTAEYLKKLAGVEVVPAVPAIPPPVDVTPGPEIFSAPMPPAPPIPVVPAALPALPEAPPIPVVSAAPLPPAPPAPPAPGVELDSEGVPWDGRIHSSSKNKVEGGKWRLRRNLDPALRDQVIAELKSAQAAPAAIVPPPPAPEAPAAIAPPPPPPAPPAPAPLSFPALLKAITERKITREQCNAATNKAGLPSFAILATRPDLVPQIAAELRIS